MRYLVSSIALCGAALGGDTAPSDSKPATAAAVPISRALLKEVEPFSSLPRWLTLGGLVRARVESPSGIAYAPGISDTFYAQRVRVDLSVRPVWWARVYAQTQDTRGWGYNMGARPASLNNPLDLRQLYAEVGQPEGPGVRVRVGRQELSYAGGWLVSPGEWGNTTRVFDAALTSFTTTRNRVDAFAGSTVLADSGRIDRHKPGEHLYGVDWNTQAIVPNASLEVFTMAKTQDLVTGETGSRGAARMWLSGARAVGRLPARFDYTVLLAREWGYYASDSISAAFTSAIVGWRVTGASWKPRVSVEADFGSGDGNAKDGRRNGFDQIYGSFHYLLGTSDRFGMRNGRNLRAGFDCAPAKRWKLLVDVRDFTLRTVQDGLYNTSATRDVLNAKARSRHAGVEVDTFFAYQLNPVTTVGAGIARLTPGAYLKASTKGGAYTHPYVMFTRKF